MEYCNNRIQRDTNIGIFSWPVDESRTLFDKSMSIARKNEMYFS